ALRRRRGAGTAAQPRRARRRRTAAHLVLDTEAVVAVVAARLGPRIAEVAQDEGAAAVLGIGVLLHRLELAELAAPPPVETLPIHRPVADRPRRLHQREAFAEALPDDELPGLQRIEQR